jgi:F-type H+-transporting ATPase subunit delta
MATPATIARPYAQAVFEIACEEHAAEDWSRMLDLMVAIVAVPEMDAAIGDPEADRAAVLGIIAEAGGDRFDEHARTLLHVLSDNRRLRALPWIALRYEDLRAEAERRTSASVVAAHPISPAEAARLKASLEATLGRTVQLDCSVDESLVAGAIIRIGDHVIDGSVSGRLRELAQHLV